MAYIYFKENEIVGLDKYLVQLLDIARSHAGIPFIITSGLRTKEQNTAIGGVSNSAHLKGLAVDLKCEQSDLRYLMISGLLQAGFRRIGVYKQHIHADIDNSKPINVIFIDLD